MSSWYRRSVASMVGESSMSMRTKIPFAEARSRTLGDETFRDSLERYAEGNPRRSGYRREFPGNGIAYEKVRRVLVEHGLIADDA